MKRLTILTALATALAMGCGDCSPPTESTTTTEDIDTVEEWLQLRAHPLEGIDDLQPLLDEADGRELILLGESTHGTREYYDWRAQMTLALAKEQGIDFVGIEGDWHAARAADRYVMGGADAETAREVVEQAFERWPQWMWANEEFAAFLEELRLFNAENPQRPVRVYGIDMHAVFESLDRLLELVNEDHPDQAGQIGAHLGCLRRFSPHAGQYSNAIQQGATEGCEEEIGAAVASVRRLYDGDDVRHLSARKHARVVESGEAQYRKRVTGDDSDFWNVRAAHMFDAVQGMLASHGDDARGVVWAHNTHVGDARATDMADRGRINIGQLSREALGHDAVFSLGFSTRTGDVIAGTQWGSPLRRAELPLPPEQSVEEMFSRHDALQFFVLFEEGDEEFEFFDHRPGHRAVGVVYHPDREHLGNYVPTNPAARYDALIYLDETSALTPL